MDRVFCYFGPLTLLTTRKIKILKKWNTWRYYHFTLVYHKWQSYDACSLRYGVQKTIFCHFRPFFAIFKNLNKNAQRYYHSTSVYHKWKSYNEWFLRYGTEFFLILDHLLAFFKILKKWKKVWKYHHYT